MKLTAKKIFWNNRQNIKRTKKKGESYATESKPNKGLHQVYKTIMLFFLIECTLAYFDLTHDTKAPK